MTLSMGIPHEAGLSEQSDDVAVNSMDSSVMLRGRQRVLH